METADSRVDRLLSEYLDRLNQGEEIDPLEVLAAHPDVGGDVLEGIETWYELESGEGSAVALGTLGDYTLRRQIGRGGMGVVYEAWENSMDRAVALKVLPGAVAADERALQRFVREAKVAGDLHHPNVVPVYGMGLKEKTPYYAMEYVEGETLAQILESIWSADGDAETPFGPRSRQDFYIRVADAFADVADGFQHAHAKGIVHRDVKPSNLILDGKGRLRILDFGLARFEGQEALTVSGDVVGTPLYMSPEQARRRKIPIDHRTDVYSLGTTLYEALTGRPPFQGKDHADTLSQIIERNPPDPGSLNAKIPRDLGTIVLKCLRKSQDDRYSTAEALAQDLRRYVRGDPVEARSEAPWSRIRRRLIRHRRVAIVALCCLAALLFGVFLFYREMRERTHSEYSQILEQLREAEGMPPGQQKHRLQAHLYHRLRHWDAALETGRAAIASEPPDLLTYLVHATVTLGRTTDELAGVQEELTVELARTAVDAVRRFPDDRRAERLLRTAVAVLDSALAMDQGSSSMREARRTAFSTAKAAGIAIADAGPTGVRELFDDFADEKIFDGNPVLWQNPNDEGYIPGEFTVTGDRVCMRGSRGGTVTGFSTEEVFAGDVSLVIEAPPLRKLVGGQICSSLVTRGFYWVTFNSGRITLQRFDDRRGRKLDKRSFDSLPFDIRAVDFAFELRTRGRHVEVLVWPTDRAAQETDLVLSIEDTMYRVGSAGPSGDQGGCIRSVRIIEGSQPGPAR